MRLVYVDFMSDAVLAESDSGAVPPDHQIVRLPGEEGWRHVMHSEWHVVQRPGAPEGYHTNVVWTYLTEPRGA
jgi:hypothetical protein